MNEIVKELEVTLGPDTADLSMRIGLHSGPVTAGVLRGDKARFQLVREINLQNVSRSTICLLTLHLSDIFNFFT